MLIVFLPNNLIFLGEKESKYIHHYYNLVRFYHFSSSPLLISWYLYISGLFFYPDFYQFADVQTFLMFFFHSLYHQIASILIIVSN